MSIDNVEESKESEFVEREEGILRTYARRAGIVFFIGLAAYGFSQGLTSDESPLDRIDLPGLYRSLTPESSGEPGYQSPEGINRAPTKETVRNA